MASELMSVLAEFADVRSRADAVARLARFVGATALHVFVRDVDLGVLLAAPGLSQTVPDHPSWDALLAACETPGMHDANVLDIGSGALVFAKAFVGQDGTVFVFIREPSIIIDADELALPLLGALLRAEQRSSAAMGEAEASKGAARHANALTVALEKARLDLEHAVHEKQELLREQGMLIGIVGHDLRNPLSTIVMGAALLLDHSDLPAAQIKVLQRIRSSSKRMERMIAALLDFERSRQGGIPIARTDMALRVVVAQVVEEMELSHPTRTIKFSSNCDGLGGWDADRLAQVVSNLVGNAVQHSPLETPIMISLTESGDELVLEVSNEHACAIPADDLSQLFEPFRRGKQSTGLGLGLYIVKQIAEAHGGSVGATSHADRTTFVVTLPRSAGERSG